MKAHLRQIIFVTVLMAIPVGTWWFVFRPWNARNAELTRQIEARQEKLRALNQVTGTIGDLEHEIAARREAIAYFQAKLPSEKEIDKVLQEIWRIAESNRLTTKSIRTLTKDRGNQQQQVLPTLAGGLQPSEQPIAVQLEGDFAGFYAFLQALENQPRIMQIRKMALRKLDKAPEGYIQASFEMSVFFESDKRG